MHIVQSYSKVCIVSHHFEALSHSVLLFLYLTIHVHSSYHYLAYETDCVQMAPLFVTFYSIRSGCLQSGAENVL